MQGLRARGVPQAIVCPRGSAMHARAGAEGLAVLPMRIRNEVDTGALGRIVAALRRAPADVLHAHTSQAHGLAAMAARLRGRRRPRVVVTRRVDYSIFRHAFLRLDRVKYDPGADLVLCVSAKIRDVLRADGLPDDRLRVVHSGIDLARFRAAHASPAALRAELGIPEGAPVIGNVAHMADHKGQRYLVASMPDVLQQRPEARALIVGDGELRGALAAQAAELGVAERVVFAGFRRDVPDLLGLMDVFCFPSHMEGLGTSILDALAMARPVVATTAGGIPEIIEDGVHGLLVPPKAPSALAHALLRMLDDPDAARRMALAGKARVESAFSVDRMVDGTLEAYRYVSRCS